MRLEDGEKFKLLFSLLLPFSYRCCHSTQHQLLPSASTHHTGVKSNKSTSISHMINCKLYFILLYCIIYRFLFNSKTENLFLSSRANLNIFEPQDNGPPHTCPLLLDDRHTCAAAAAAAILVPLLIADISDEFLWNTYLLSSFGISKRKRKKTTQHRKTKFKSFFSPSSSLRCFSHSTRYICFELSVCVPIQNIFSYYILPYILEVACRLYAYALDLIIHQHHGTCVLDSTGVCRRERKCEKKSNTELLRMYALCVTTTVRSSPPSVFSLEWEFRLVASDFILCRVEKF